MVYTRYSCVIRQNVDPAVCVITSTDQGLNLRWVGDVSLNRDCLSTGAVDLIPGLLCSLAWISATTTLAPSAANHRAIARPIPVPLPVTTATLFANRMFVFPHSSGSEEGSSSTALNSSLAAASSSCRTLILTGDLFERPTPKSPI